MDILTQVTKVIEFCVSPKILNIRDKLMPDTALSTLELEDEDFIDILMRLDEALDIANITVETDHMREWTIREFASFVEKNISGTYAYV